ncbi:hypothetical protein AB1Y20_002046 [Prymnesium parvum]|uniref:Anaphase-promoting complex subunit 5 n=1 Tax=Prymnesium parvum TaxID=97485 RepID=A0AB34J9G1_PRYPA
MANERLSPRGVALSHLIDMFCSYRPEPGDTFPLESRQQLAIILVQQVHGNGGSDVIEPTCAATLECVSSLPRSFVAAFYKRLHETTEPDDLWTLMSSLSDAMETPSLGEAAETPMEAENGPMHLERTSVLGIYVRRLLLYFRRSTFEAICTLTSHFQQWVRAPAAPAADTPPWAHSLPLKQVEAGVSRLVHLVEGGSSVALSELRARVAQLQLHAPQIPQVHYLQMLLHMHERSFDQALEQFHRYFDSIRASTTSGVMSSSLPLPGIGARPEQGRPLTQWAGLNLARLHLSFGHRQQAVIALQEAMRSAQQHEDNACLAYALLLLAQAYEGSGADAWGELIPPGEEGASTEANGAQRQQSLLRRCLARAHELHLPELASLASEALALRSIGVAAVSSTIEPHTVSATPDPKLKVGRAPPLPPAALKLPGALPTLAAQQPPPLHVWEALRCGAEGYGACTQLVRACAWEHFGHALLVSLHASLQLRFHKPSVVCAPPSADGKSRASSLSLGRGWLRPCAADRVLAAAKLALLQEAQHGERAALESLLTLRPWCTWGPQRAIWLQHTAEVLLRGALTRGEVQRAGDLLALYTNLLTATDGATDAAWMPTLELLLQKGSLVQALLQAEEYSKLPATGRGAGSSNPAAICLLMQAKAHALGGSPLKALPPVLSAIALCEEHSLHSLHAAAVLLLVSVELELDAARALALLQRVRAHVLQNGSAYDISQLQLLSAKCRLAALPPYSASHAPQLQQLRAHILPALEDALKGFVKLRCHAEAAQALYYRARLYHTVGREEDKQRDAHMYVRAQHEATQSAARLSGRLVDFAEEGVLEEHIAQLQQLDAAAAAMYPGL